MKYYQHRDYLKMIITGFLYNYDYLTQYIVREQKKAEKDNITFSEFIGRTITVIKDLEGEFYRLRRQKELELEDKKDGTNDTVIEKQIEGLRLTEDFRVQLADYTDGEINGTLGFWDINEFRQAINEAFDFYSIEKKGENIGAIEYFKDDEIKLGNNSTDVSNKRSEKDLDEKFSHNTWFKIGVTFATGQAQELYEKYKGYKGHFTKVATELGFKETDRPYISETINNTTLDNKNIYASPEKLSKIYSYCQKNNIEVCPDFKAKLPGK